MHQQKSLSSEEAFLFFDVVPSLQIIDQSGEGGLVVRGLVFVNNTFCRQLVEQFYGFPEFRQCLFFVFHQPDALYCRPHS
jgi:hypothetical protein